MEMMTAKVWDDVLDVIKPDLEKESFETWFEPVEYHSFGNDTLKLTVPSDLYRKWLLSNCYDQITNAVEKLTRRRCRIEFITPDYDYEDEDGPAPKTSGNGSDVSTTASGIDFASTRLNPRYVFESFVVGESNRFAHAAAQAVSDPSSRAYNPLFIYGGVGLGKTHLMQAVGHELLKKRPDALALYVTSEQFMNAFIDAISKNKQYEFRNYYRNADLLLVDDVQFFMGKEHTQTQFFHTFNALYDAGKKIVISSDRPPKDLATLELRLRSRFEWGLTVDIQPPDLETRIAIIKRKAEQMNFELPEDIAQFIGERVDTNIRSLEGALVRLHAYVKIHGRKTLTPKVVRENIGDLLTGDVEEQISMAAVQAAVCEYFDIKLADLIGHSRSRKFSNPRHIAQYLCRRLTNKSLPDVGVHFGGRDHSSVLHACRKIEKKLDKDPSLENMINYLTKLIKERS